MKINDDYGALLEYMLKNHRKIHKTKSEKYREESDKKRTTFVAVDNIDRFLGECEKHPHSNTNAKQRYLAFVDRQINW